MISRTGMHRSERVRNMGHCNQRRPRPKAPLELFDDQLAVIVYGRNDKARTGLLQSNCHGTMLEWCSRAEIRISSPAFKCDPSIGRRDEVDRFGGSADEDDLAFAPGIDEMLHSSSRMLHTPWWRAR